MTRGDSRDRARHDLSQVRLDGRFGRVLPGGGWLRHDDVWLETNADGRGHDALAELTITSKVWKTPAEVPLFRSGPQLLDDFLRLYKAPSQRFVEFATKWGVPELCSHGQHRGHEGVAYPGGHRQLMGLEGCPEFPRREVADGFVDFVAVDSIRKWATAFRAALDLTMRVRLATDPFAEDIPYELLQELGGTYGVYDIDTESFARDHGYAPPPKNFDATFVRHRVGDWVDDLLLQCRIAPSFEWYYEDPVMEMDLWGPVSAAALQVATSIANKGARGWALCANCGDAFIPDRAPRAGQSSWCKKQICKAAAVRVASKRYKARQRKTKG